MHHLAARRAHRAGGGRPPGHERRPGAGGHHHRVAAELAVRRHARHPSAALEEPVDLRGDEPRARADRGHGERARPAAGCPPAASPGKCAAPRTSADSSGSSARVAAASSHAASSPRRSLPADAPAGPGSMPASSSCTREHPAGAEGDVDVADLAQLTDELRVERPAARHSSRNGPGPSASAWGARIPPAALEASAPGMLRSSTVHRTPACCSRQAMRAADHARPDDQHLHQRCSVGGASGRTGIGGCGS